MISIFYSHYAPFICHSVLSHCYNFVAGGVQCDHNHHSFVIDVIMPVGCSKTSSHISLNTILHGTMLYKNLATSDWSSLYKET
jgi:hypothetical protein